MHSCLRTIATLLLVVGLASHPLIAQSGSDRPDILNRYLVNQSPTYDQVIAFYQSMDEQFAKAQLIEYGKADIGRPMYLFLISNQQQFTSSDWQTTDKTVVFINNGIHPGEPAGVDASMNLVYDLLTGQQDPDELEDVILATIPLYNVGGALNRNAFTRANQNGPEVHGFRGNARNLDLNRDFIKMDSDNAKVFARIFHDLDPDFFVDTHTTNGADYQHTMTLISTQHNKLGFGLGEFLENDLDPFLYAQMKARDDAMTPYVYSIGRTPDAEGIRGFMDSPRYSSGYTALFHTIGFITETHMLKPYPQRVESQYRFLDILLQFAADQGPRVQKLRAKAKKEAAAQTTYPLNWKLNREQFEDFAFQGFESELVPSKVTNQQRLHYDRESPYTKAIPFYNTYVAQTKVEKPQAYLIPQAWDGVIERLTFNGVQLERLEKDQTIEVQVLYLNDVETQNRPYEGHYLHSGVTVQADTVELQYYRGDYLVKTGQPVDRYLVETLDPRGIDSFFAWNFFDSVLMQKEYFSDYVFEDSAEEILKEKPWLKDSLQARITSDQEFANNHYAQLYYIYRNSKYYEDTHRRYPVGYVLTDKQLNDIQTVTTD
ncbi:MAG: M14 family zinc carboxypeptidase [Bacteroidota bacterium]